MSDVTFWAGEMITQKMAWQRGMRLWNIIHFSSSLSGLSLCWWGKVAEPLPFSCPSLPTLCRYTLHFLQVRAQVCLAIIQIPVSPSTPLCISEISGQSLAQKVLTSKAISVPDGPAHMRTNIMCLKDSSGTLHLLPVFVECRSFTRNHWFVLVSSKNKLQCQRRMKRSCVVFVIQQEKLPPGGTSH